MIKVSKLFASSKHRSASRFTARCWVDPQGQVILVDSPENASKYGFVTHFEIIREHGFEHERDAVSAGWIRLGMYETEFYIQGIKCNSVQFDAIWNLVASAHPREVQVDCAVSGKFPTEEFLLFNSMNDAQKAANRLKARPPQIIIPSELERLERHLTASD